MKKLKNKNGFTLVELLAVIVVLAIVMGIAAVSITNVLDNTRKNTYISSAQQYIQGARDLVNADQTNLMLGVATEYAPKCQAAANGVNNSKTISLKEINTEKNDNDKSPYGNKIHKGDTGEENTFVKVEAIFNSTTGECTYEYSIYITDGVYRIGTSTNPVKESELESSKVQVATAS